MLNTEGLSQEIIDFCESNKHLECSHEEFLSMFQNTRNAHNHTIENLYLYFKLDYHLQKNRVLFYPGALLIVDNRKHKFFIYDNSLLLECLDISKLPVDLYKKVIFYSSVEQNNLPEVYEKSKLKEFVYNFDEIFNEDTYREKYKGESGKKIRKKIYQRLVYPLNVLSKLNLECRDITEQDLDEIVESLHKEWVDYKMDDPKTFKMMFSSNRYNHCIRLMFNHKFLKRENFYCKVFLLDGKPIAIRQILIKGENAFDIGFFSKFWQCPSNTILYLNFFVFNELKELGVKTLNCGMELDKHLKMSKNHYPGQELIVYKFNLKAK